MNNLKKIRLLDQKMSQFEFSRKTGVHPSRISLIENGLATPSLKESERISTALNMLPEEIFGLDAVMTRLTASRRRKD